MTQRNIINDLHKKMKEIIKAIPKVVRVLDPQKDSYIFSRFLDLLLDEYNGDENEKGFWNNRVSLLESFVKGSSTKKRTTSTKYVINLIYKTLKFVPLY